MSSQVRRRPEYAPIPITDLAGRVIASWNEDRDLSVQTVRRLAETASRFGTYLEQGQGLSNAHEITRPHVEAFVNASIGTAHGSRTPAIATMHLRRATLRLLFRSARELGLFEGDPTLDVHLPPRSSLRCRPLTNEEIALCRSFSLSTLTESRRPAAWALAEATVRTSEIPAIRVCDVDLDRGRVWIAGSMKTEPRWGALTLWSLKQIERRLGYLGRRADGDTPLVYRGKGSPESQQASSSIAISETLVAAGLGDEPDVRPASVAAWSGVQIFKETGRIEEVAKRLGIRSLDRAARFIGWGWRDGVEDAEGSEG